MKTKKLVVSIVVLSSIIVGGMGVVAFKNVAPADDPPKITDKVVTSKSSIAFDFDSQRLNGRSTDTSVLVSVAAADAADIRYVVFLLDNEQIDVVYTEPYEMWLDIEALAAGKHALQAVAYTYDGSVLHTEIINFSVDEPEKADDQVVLANKQTTGSVPGIIQKAIGLLKPVAKPANPVYSTPPPSGAPAAQPALARAAGGWWNTLPQSMQVCSLNPHLQGPTSAPDGAVVVPAGDNSGVTFNQPNTVYWFAPGVHTLGETDYSQVVPGSGSTFVGAPGSVIDGQRINRYAFGGMASDVTIRYVEIRNFGRGNDNNNEGVINHDSGTGWVMDHLFAHHNDGAAIFMGTDNTLSNSCVRDNGQYGFSMFKPPVPGEAAIKNIVITNNEISGNNTDDWEAQLPGCGCSGGGKFWDVEGALVTNNYVHSNKGTGLWADTNNIDFLFDSNWIEGNDGEGIWYEISYNATISRNVLKANAWVKGQANTGSPAPAIYLSESGGEDRLSSTVSGSTNLQVKNNLIEDNFSGVTIYENSNRFCNSNGNTSTTYCTPFVEPNQLSEPYDSNYPNPISSVHPCYTDISSDPYTYDCRWHAKNIKVFQNEFRFNKQNVPCAGSYCGAQSLLATGADNIPWAPNDYAIAAVQNKVLFNSGNEFYDNDYYGEWKYTKAYGESISRYGWQAGPYNQDVGSTFTGGVEVGNQLDEDSATFESSIGKWTSWYGTTVYRTVDGARTGAASMQIDIQDQFWGVNLTNYPGFDSWPGSHRISYWAKKNELDTVQGMVLLVDWKDSSGQNIKAESDRVPIDVLTGDWQRAEAVLVAPEGTTAVFLSLAGSSGSSGDTLYVDDIEIQYLTAE
jgi:hypothetical protein